MSVWQSSEIVLYVEMKVPPKKYKSPKIQSASGLESKKDEESNHQTEKTHGLGEGESQNGVWEELTLQWWVTSVANDEGTENCSNTWKKILKLQSWNFYTHGLLGNKPFKKMCGKKYHALKVVAATKWGLLFYQIQNQCRIRRTFFSHYWDRNLSN